MRRVLATTVAAGSAGLQMRQIPLEAVIDEPSYHLPRWHERLVFANPRCSQSPLRHPKERPSTHGTGHVVTTSRSVVCAWR